MAEVGGTAGASAESFSSRAPRGAGRKGTRLVERDPVIVTSGEVAARLASMPILRDLRVDSQTQHSAAPINVFVIEAETLDDIRPTISFQHSGQRGVSNTLSSLLPEIKGLSSHHLRVILEPSTHTRPRRR